MGAGIDSAFYRVEEIEGTEGISQLFRYEISLRCKQQNCLSGEEMTDLLSADQCTLNYGEEGEYAIEGVVRDFTHASSAMEPRGLTYKVTLVPRLWRATRSFRTRVFRDLSLREILCFDLQEYGYDDVEFIGLTDTQTTSAHQY